MWDMDSINEESHVDFKGSPVFWRCCWRFALTNAKGSFESGKFTLNITCESGKLFTTGCRPPPKSTNFGALTTRVWIRHRMENRRSLPLVAALVSSILSPPPPPPPPSPSPIPPGIPGHCLRLCLLSHCQSIHTVRCSCLIVPRPGRRHRRRRCPFE